MSWKLKNYHDNKSEHIYFWYVWSKMLSSSLYAMLKLSKTTSPNKLFDYDCVTLYMCYICLTSEVKVVKKLKWRDRLHFFVCFVKFHEIDHNLEMILLSDIHTYLHAHESILRMSYTLIKYIQKTGLHSPWPTPLHHPLPNPSSFLFYGNELHHIKRFNNVFIQIQLPQGKVENIFTK